MPSIRNIIIFISIAAVLVLGYIFFVRKPAAPVANLVATPGSDIVPVTGAPGAESSTGSPIAADFLTLLLSVKNIKLDDSIFADPAWSSLRDSSIELVPDGTEGRPNPFAPFGSDSVSSGSISSSGTSTAPLQGAGGVQ